ncbi:MAG: hypothetical protein R3E76_16345 [Planctomycetota bacterium]
MAFAFLGHGGRAIHGHWLKELSMGQASEKKWHSPDAVFATVSGVVEGTRPLLWIARRVESDGEEVWEFRDHLPLSFGNVVPLRNPSFLIERHDCLNLVRDLNANHVALRESEGDAWTVVELTDALDIEFMRTVDLREAQTAESAPQIAADDLACVVLRWGPDGLTSQQMRAARARFNRVGRIPFGEFRRLIGSHSELIAAEDLRWLEATRLAKAATIAGLEVEVRPATDQVE